MKRIICMLCFFWGHIPLMAQGFNEVPGILSSSVYAVSNQDALGYLQNPAAAARALKPQIAMGTSRPFLTEGLQEQLISFFFPAGSGSFGLMGKRYGTPVFWENTLMLCYARTVSAHVEAALGLGMEKTSIRGYPGASVPLGSLSVRALLKPRLYMGFQWINPWVMITAKGHAGIRHPASMHTGLGWSPSEQHFIAVTAIKSFPGLIKCNASFHYSFARQFFARLGFSGFKNQFETGLGYSIRNYRLMITGSYHPSLGLSPGIWMFADFNSKK